MTQFPGKTKPIYFPIGDNQPKEKVEEEEYVVRSVPFRYTAVGLNCSLLPIQKLALITNQTAIDSASFGAVDVGSCCCCLNDENFYFTSSATKKVFQKPNPGPSPPPIFVFVPQILDFVVVVQVMRIKNNFFQNLKPKTFSSPPSFLNFCDVAMNGRPSSTRGISQIRVHVEEDDPSFPPSVFEKWPSGQSVFPVRCIYVSGVGNGHRGRPDLRTRRWLQSWIWPMAIVCHHHWHPVGGEILPGEKNP